MPTWRESALLDGLTFGHTKYARAILELLESPGLRDVLEAHRARVDLVLHPIVRARALPWLKLRATAHVRVPSVSDPQGLFASAGALITDYSSVAWDFLYMNKPVIFYHFDREYIDERGSHVDDDGMAWPGVVTTTAEEVVVEIERYLSGALSADRRVADRAEAAGREMFAFRDEENCKRLAGEIFRRLDERGTPRAR
jgi:CDP-glycerol glycerophosphotransferase (TagB/SpsB family)